MLAGERRDCSPLLAPGPSPKIGALDKHVAYVMSGIAPDGRYLVRRGRLLAQVGSGPSQLTALDKLDERL